MRPLEAVLFVTLGSSFLAAAARPRRSTWTVALVAAAALAALLQIVLEGARWQLTPAYAVAALLLIGFIGLRLGVDRLSLPRPLPGLLWALGSAAGLISLALALMLPVFSLPLPSGPYAIGTLAYHWIDESRGDAFTSDPDDRRELMVQLWYPARAMPGATPMPYVPDGAVLAPLARLLQLPDFTLSHLSYVTANAVNAAPMAGDRERFPVLIFSHGRGGYRQHNTLLVEELVSHGYVVAAIDHPSAASGVAFPDGRVVTFDPRMRDRPFVTDMIPYLTEDALFVFRRLAELDRADTAGRLTGRLDLERAGMFGLSLGGEVTAEACRLEPRLKACLMMDVWMPADVVESGLDQPSLWLTRDAATMQREGWAQADIDETLTTMRQVYETLPGAGYYIQVPDMYHQDFSDAPLLSPLTSVLGLTGPIGPTRARQIVAAYSLAFFDRHLRGGSGGLLDGPSTDFPEVQVETRLP